MYLHLILEILCAFIGFILVRHVSKDLYNYITLKWFGWFLLLTEGLHIVASIFGELYIGVAAYEAIPISWLLPNLTIPYWLYLLGYKPFILSKKILYIAGCAIALTTLLILMRTDILISQHVIGRPFELLGAIVAVVFLKKIFHNNGVGKTLSFMLVLYIVQQIFMGFSLSLYDSYFMIAHTLKLSWHLAALLMLYNPQQDLQTKLNELQNG